MKGVARAFLLVSALVAVIGEALAFSPIPRESADALGLTRGKAFSCGCVFVNGRYLAPPYVVERWGTGIRVNGTQVTGQVVNWNAFLMTQKGVKVSRSDVSAAERKSATATVSDAVDTLDDLFDDGEKAVRAKPKPSAVGKGVEKPRVVVTYSLEGDFVPNEASKALLGKVNAVRTEIDRVLRSGGFVCFGDGYSRVSGDRRAMVKMLESLVDLQKNSTDSADFRSGVQREGLVYFNETLCEQLYQNRVDYLKLRKRLDRLKLGEGLDVVSEILP